MAERSAHYPHYTYHEIGFRIARREAAPTITSGNKLFNEDTYGEYQIVATNNPVSYGASGLPPGFSVDAETGLISGTYTYGSYYVTITATNEVGTTSKIVRFIQNPTWGF